ncbi:hypothetical protein FRC11_012809 [Ceratobasidium sp. 423]|nr:hypothetical protein FRC11_012809 [Ceratobasidium sp. 423]
MGCMDNSAKHMQWFNLEDDFATAKIAILGAPGPTVQSPGGGIDDNGAGQSWYSEGIEDGVGTVPGGKDDSEEDGEDDGKDNGDGDGKEDESEDEDKDKDEDEDENPQDDLNMHSDGGGTDIEDPAHHSHIHSLS